MDLWLQWWSLVWNLRPAFSRIRTFLWFAVALAAMDVRSDRLGVTSLVRALGLQAPCYDRLLDWFHSPGIHLETLATVCFSDAATRSTQGAFREELSHAVSKMSLADVGSHRFRDLDLGPAFGANDGRFGGAHIGFIPLP
jgi:hypothetical protein